MVPQSILNKISYLEIRWYLKSLFTQISLPQADHSGLILDLRRLSLAGRKPTISPVIIHDMCPSSLPYITHNMAPNKKHLKHISLSFCQILNIICLWQFKSKHLKVRGIQKGQATFKQNEYSWIILCMRPTNERCRNNVTSHLIGWSHAQNDP